MGNHLNRLRIDVRGRRHGRLSGRLYGRLVNRLKGCLRNHHCDDLLDDFGGNPYDEPGDRNANPEPCLGSQAVARAVPRDVGCSVVQPLAMPISCPSDCSQAESATHSGPRSSTGFSRRAASRLMDNTPDHSFAMFPDVAGAEALVCSRPCFLPGHRRGPGARHRPRAADLLHRTLAGEPDVGAARTRGRARKERPPEFRWPWA